MSLVLSGDPQTGELSGGAALTEPAKAFLRASASPAYAACISVRHAKIRGLGAEVKAVRRFPPIPAPWRTSLRMRLRQAGRYRASRARSLRSGTRTSSRACPRLRIMRASPP